MIPKLVESTIGTCIIVLFIPLIGLVIDKVVNLILRIISKKLGCKTANFIHNWLTFIGTIHHELSHALLAILSGAKVVKVELFKPNKSTLGSVVFIPRGNIFIQGIQLTLTAMAPVVLGFISSYILTFKVLAICENGITKGLIIYLIISILMHSTMSSQDIKNWIKGLPCTVLIIFVLVYISGFSVVTV